MQICTHAMKVETFNAGLHAAMAEKVTLSHSAGEQAASNDLSFSALDQTFTLTASKRKNKRFINRNLLTSAIISAVFA